MSNRPLKFVVNKQAERPFATFLVIFAISTLFVWVLERLESGFATAFDMHEVTVGVIGGLIISLLTSMQLATLLNGERLEMGRVWLEKTEEERRKSVSFARTLLNLNSSHPVIRKCGTAAFDTFHEYFSVSNKSLEFIGEMASLRAFKELWQHLIYEQRSRGANSSICCFAVHVVSARVWTDPGSGELRRLQKEFCDTGGSVFRIFVATKKIPT